MIDTIKVPAFGRKEEYLMMKRDGKVYVYMEPITIVERWSQGGMGAGASRKMKMYNVPDYGETEYLTEYRMEDFIDSKIEEGKDIEVYDASSFTKKKFREQFGS